MKFAWEHVVGILGLAVLVYGQVLGLFLTPPDAHMGEVARILYVHVPSAWNGFLWLGIACLCALAYLFTDFVVWIVGLVGRPPDPARVGTIRRWLDHALEATVEVGTLLILLLTLQGSIFARPTWGVWWTWDPRLTSTAVMLLTFVGVLVLRSLVQDRELRATWSSAVTVMAAVTLPITYYSVQLWRSIHQLQSGPADMDSPLRTALYINFGAMVLVSLWFVVRRWRVARRTWEQDEAPPLPEAAA
jgi:heme exporter protein C